MIAAAAVAAGATLVNDVSASLGEVAAATGAGWVAMHMQGEPGTMQAAPRYGDVVAEVRAALVAVVDDARALGVDECWIDPGIGFGKTFEHNWSLLAALDRFVETGIPVAVGTSRKGFLGEATDVNQIAGLEGELTRREAELASVEAQRRSLADQVALSTVTVVFDAARSDPAPVEDDDRTLPTFLGGLEAGWDAAVAVVAVLLAGAGLLLPFLPLLVVAALVWRWRRGRRVAPTP